MPFFVRKPAIVQAEQYQPGMSHPGIKFDCRPGMKNAPYVTTMQGGTSHLKPGDWIIAEETPGCYYGCDEHVFSETYFRTSV